MLNEIAGSRDCLTLTEAFIKTIDHFVPCFWSALSKMPDPRDSNRIRYPIEEEVLIGILTFIMKLGARRNIKYKFNSPVFVSNIKQIGGIFYPENKFPDTILHGDTLNYLLSGIDPQRIHNLRKLVIRSLVRKRCLENYRLLKRYYTIAIDGTGYLAFKKRHCEHCLKRVVKGKNFYLHQVLEAKLVLPGIGMALSISSEFIENEKEDVSKQDCELKAFYRLIKKLKSDFPQLDICLLLDGLYAAKPVMEVIKEMGWNYLITFKEGHGKSMFEEYEALLKFLPDNSLEKREGEICHSYRWVYDMDWNGEIVHGFEDRQETPEGKKRFVWLSSIRADRNNVEELSQGGGRSRWIIENQGFNTQKNGGYALEHAFSTNNWGMKNFYLLMQIAHIFNQLMEKGSLLRERIRTEMGSLKVFSDWLWSAFTGIWIDVKRLCSILKRRFQIRFNTS
jgi:hypothetical protein